MSDGLEQLVKEAIKKHDLQDDDLDGFTIELNKNMVAAVEASAQAAKQGAHNQTRLRAKYKEELMKVAGRAHEVTSVILKYRRLGLDV